MLSVPTLGISTCVKAYKYIILPDLRYIARLVICKFVLYPQVCWKESCVRLSSEILARVNLSVDPCEVREVSLLLSF